MANRQSEKDCFRGGKKLFTTVIGTGDHDRSQKTGHKNADAVIVMIAQTGYDRNRTYRKVIGPRLFG